MASTDPTPVHATDLAVPLPPPPAVERTPTLVTLTAEETAGRHDSEAAAGRLVRLRHMPLGDVINLRTTLVQYVGENVRDDQIYKGWERALLGPNKVEAAASFDAAEKIDLRLAHQNGQMPTPPLELPPMTRTYNGPPPTTWAFGDNEPEPEPATEPAPEPESACPWAERPTPARSLDGKRRKYHNDSTDPNLVPKEKLIQGGVLHRGGARKALQKHLDKCDYDPKSCDFYVTLFPDSDGRFDASVFHGPKNLTDYERDFQEVNIVGVPLHDPTPEHPWNEKELLTFFRAIDGVAKDLHDGKWAIVACMAGKNRSKGVLYALDPRPINEPRCPAVLEAAKAYINKRSKVPFPLFPKKELRSTKRARE